jgi:hypothetical protein
MKKLITITMITLFTACMTPKNVITHIDGFGYESEKTLIFKDKKKAEKFQRRYSGELNDSSVTIPIELFNNLPKKYKK